MNSVPNVVYRPVPGMADVYAGTDASIVHPKIGILPQKLYKGHKYLEVHIPYTGTGMTHVHVLVAAAFLGPRPDGMDIRHGPGGRLDNSPENLCYGTRKDNVQDSVTDGTHISWHGKSKTKCDQGHEFTPKNTYTPPGTSFRHCRTCRAVAARKAEKTRPPRIKPKPKRHKTLGDE